MSNSIIYELFDVRRDKFAYNDMKKSNDRNELVSDIEKKLNNLSNFIQEDKKEFYKKEIEDTFDKIGKLTEYWDFLFYKNGFADGMTLRKEIENR